MLISGVIFTLVRTFSFGVRRRFYDYSPFRKCACLDMLQHERQLGSRRVSFLLLKFPISLRGTEATAQQEIERELSGTKYQDEQRSE